MWQFSLSVAGDGKVVAGDGNSVCLVVVLVVILVAIVIILYLVSGFSQDDCSPCPDSSAATTARPRAPCRPRWRQM